MTTSVIRPSRICLVIHETDLCSWFGEALPGTVLQYHHGFLALDVDAHGSRMCERDRAELQRVASRARSAVDQGLAHLVQRRHGTDDYSYLLIKRPTPRTTTAHRPGVGIAGTDSEERVVTAGAVVPK